MTPAAADPPTAGSRPAARAAVSITRTTRGRAAAQNAIRTSVPAYPGSPAPPVALPALPPPGSPAALLSPATLLSPAALPPSPGCPFAPARPSRVAGQPHQAGGDGRAAAP